MIEFYAWKTKPLWACTEINRKTLTEDTAPEMLIDYVDISSVNSLGEIEKYETMRFESSPSRARRIVVDGTVIISTVRTYLKAISYISKKTQNDRIVSTGFATLDACHKMLNPLFLSYAVRNDFFIREVCARSVGVSYPAITPWELSKIHIPIPPLETQRQIATYLDKKTEAIDTLIAKKQKMIELLEEKRSALINHVVTKGLNPDAPMKDSGVPWIGEVPAHWYVTRLGWISTLIQTGPFGSQLGAHEYIDHGIPVINPSNLKDGLIEPDFTKSTSLETAQRLHRHRIKEGDIVLGRRGEMGRYGLATKDNVGWICGTGSLLIRLNTKKADPYYVGKWFDHTSVSEWFDLESVGSTMSNLNTEIVSQLPVLLAEKGEQASIRRFLVKEEHRLCVLDKNLQTQVTKLQEYRQALITAAVTGKIDVTRDPTSDDPEEAASGQGTLF